MIRLNQDFWDDRYKADQTPWDIGHVSGPLKAYIDQLSDLSLRILIPGMGNGYEAAYLHEKGFRNLTVLDISPAAVDSFLDKHPGFPRESIRTGDFFTHTGSYDLILEQTFFCALDVSLRPKYVEQMCHLLAEEGRLVGVLFNRVFEPDRPPFGGNEDEYRSLFARHFDLQVIETAYNSIPERQGSELFINFKIR